MRLHIQNPPDYPAFSFTLEQWHGAVARNPELAPLDVSISDDSGAFHAALAEAEVLLTWVNIVRDTFPGKTLHALAPRLKIISCNSAGVDRLAPFTWLPEDVSLLNNSGIHSDKAGEFGLMALLMLQNQMPTLIEGQRTKTWTQVHATTLSGRKLCIIGLGSLGGGVARRARALGMYVIGVRHGREPHPDCDETVATDEVEAALMLADDVLLACPLTEATRNILSRERLSLLRKGARVINIARGAVWDQEAVCDALEAGDLESAFTDVTVPEPLPTHHRLWTTRGLILTPHVAADDRERYNDVTLDILARNLRAARDGVPMPNRVDPLKGY